MMCHVSVVKHWFLPAQETVVPTCMAGERLNAQPADTAMNEPPQWDSRPQRVRRVPTHLKEFVTIMEQNNLRQLSQWQGRPSLAIQVIILLKENIV